MTKLKSLLDADWDRLMTLSGHANAPRQFSSLLSPRFAPVVLIRIAHILHEWGWRRLAKCVSMMNFVVFGLEVPTRLKIGPGLVIMHTQGTILGAASIGRNATLFQQVTLGAVAADFDFDPTLRPIIEDDVTITAGAKVLGAIKLGTGCVIGANAVVLEDVDSGALAVGVPARIIQRSKPT